MILNQREIRQRVRAFASWEQGHRREGNNLYPIYPTLKEVDKYEQKLTEEVLKSRLVYEQG